MDALPKDKKFYASFFLALALLGLVVAVLIMAAVPPVSRDALTHHLVLPKLFLKHGGIAAEPSVVFSYYPMNLDLLYVVPLYLGNDIAPKYIHFAFALLTAGLIFIYLQKHAGRVYGLLGALFFLSLPVIVKLSVTVYVDLGLIFFSWACLYYFLKWFSRVHQTRYLAAAAVFCGLGLGTKYNGLLVLFIMGGMIPLVYSVNINKHSASNDYGQFYRNSLNGVLNGLLFILICLIIFSPWMIRNYTLKKNPVYPLYNNWFNPDKTQSSDTGLNPFQRRRYVYKESLCETTLIPIRIFFQGKDNDPKYFDGRLNPFLFFLPFLAFVQSNRKDRLFHKHKQVLAWFSVLYIVIALFTTDMRIRYIGPAIPPLIVLAVLGVKVLVDKAARLSRGAVLFKILIVLVLISAFWVNGKYLVNLFQRIKPISYLTGKVDRDTYITRFRSEYPAIQYANRYLPDNARVLCLLIGNRTYYLDREFCLAHDFFHRNDRRTYDEAMLAERLRKTGATHIIFGLPTYDDWIKKNLTKEEMDVFEKFFDKNTELLFEKYGYQVLKIKPQEEHHLQSERYE